MKTIYTLLAVGVLFVAVAVTAFFLMDGSMFEPELRAYSAEITNEGERLIVFNEEGETIFEYGISDWQEWAETNLEQFLSEPVVIGDQVMGPERFDLFNVAEVSPEGDRVAFAVSTYAMLTTISLIGMIEIESRDVAMVGESATGGIRDLFWSTDGNLIAYSLDTARALGDFLRVDDIQNLAEYWQLSGDDVADEEDLLPQFNDLEWSENRLFFTTVDQVGRRIGWSVNESGTDLRREERVTYESTVFGISVEHPFEATANYEEERLKITYVGEDSAMTEITDGFTLFVDVKATEERSIEDVAKEEYEERTQFIDSITPPYQTEINDQEAFSFETEGGLGGVHTFFVFEVNNKIVITSQFIADPNNRDYEEMVRDIILSIDVE